MIELKYRDLVTTPIAQTLQKINSLSAFDPKTAFRLHKINEAVTARLRQVQGEYQVLGLKFAQLETNGTPRKSEQGHYVPEPDKFDEYKAEFEKFLETEFQIPQMKLHVDSMAMVMLSPQEMASLTPVVEGMPPQEDNVA